MHTTKEIVTLLSASDVFEGTPEDDLRALAEQFMEKPVKDGEIIIEEDAIGKEVFLVADGLFRVFTYEGDDDQEKESARWFPALVFMARALLQKANLLIFDESFGTLDPENLKKAVKCTLDRAKTILVIAHP
jgi:ATP-binding cassette subfamily B protein